MIEFFIFPILEHFCPLFVQTAQPEMVDALVFVLGYELGFVLIDVLFLVLCHGTMLCPCRSTCLCPCRATFSACKTTLSKNELRDAA